MFIPIDEANELTSTGVSLRGKLASEYAADPSPRVLTWLADRSKRLEVVGFFDTETSKLTFGYAEDQGTCGEDW